MERYRKLLAGQFGNLLSRSTSLALNPSQTIPAQPSMDNVHRDDIALHLKMQVLPQIVDEAMTGYKTTQATGAIFDMLAEVKRALLICRLLFCAAYLGAQLLTDIYICLRNRPTPTSLTPLRGSWPRSPAARSAWTLCSGTPWSRPARRPCSSSPSCPPRLQRFWSS